MRCISIIYTFLTYLSIQASEFVVSSESEFNYAVNNAIAGDIIIWKNGIYSDIELSFTGNGTANQPITFRAETNGQVIFQGESSISLGGEHLHVEGFDYYGGSASSNGVITFRTSSSNTASYCRVTQCRIRNVTSNTNNKYVNIYGHHNRFDHNDVGGKRNEGAMFVVWLAEFDSGGSANHTIEHNIFSDLPDGGDNGFETIRIGTSDYSHVNAQCIVSNNYFEDCSGEIEIISNKSAGNRYISNVFMECKGSLTLRHGHNNHVEGNYFFGNNQDLTAGVRIINENQVVINNYFQDLNSGSSDSDDWRGAITLVSGIENTTLNGYDQVKNAVIAHNTIINCTKPIVVGAGYGKTRSDLGGNLDQAPENCLFSHNLIYGAATAVKEKQPLIGGSYENNLVYPASSGVSTGFTTTDPDVILTNGLWRPTSSSPVVNYSGVSTVNIVSQDIDQQNRDNAPDIGADEISLPNTKNIPSPSNTGPSWLSLPQITADNQLSDWISSQYAENEQAPPSNASSEDLDQDGIMPIVEFALQGSSLFSSDRSRLPKMSFSSGSSVFSFQRNLAAKGIVYTLQRSFTLAPGSWENIASYATDSSSVWDTHTDYTVIESDNGSIHITSSQGKVKTFLRLQVNEGALPETIPATPTTNVGTTPSPTLYLEAESAINQLNFTEHWRQESSNVTPSAFYITAESKSTSDADNNGLLNYHFSLTEQSTVYIWLKVFTDSSSNNSCYIKYGSDTEWSQFHSPVSTSWQWIQWNSQSLPPGNHHLQLTYREKGYRIDQLVISTSSSFTP